jgi:hypothetical protein
MPERISVDVEKLMIDSGSGGHTAIAPVLDFFGQDKRSTVRRHPSVLSYMSRAIPAIVD